MGDQTETDATIYVHGYPFNEWFESGPESYVSAVTIPTVVEKTTDCFRVTLRMAYTVTRYYKKYTLYADNPSPPPGEVIEYITKEEDTVLFTEDLNFTFIHGENLHNKILEQESVLQAALDGYFKEELIKERGEGSIASMHITPLSGWNPSR